jgi:hypothetical protein
MLAYPARRDRIEMLAEIHQDRGFFDLRRAGRHIFTKLLKVIAKRIPHMTKTIAVATPFPFVDKLTHPPGSRRLRIFRRGNRPL